MIGAPVKCRLGPRTVAVLPEIWMSAPIRISSDACIKRFSNIVSTIFEVALGLRHQGHVLRLHVGRKSGMRLGRDVICFQAGCETSSPEACSGFSSSISTPAAANLIYHGANVIGIAAF